MELYSFYFPTHIIFGAGALTELPNALKKSGCRHPLVVTDPGLVNTQVAERLKYVLNSAGIECRIFFDLKSNPDATSVEEGIEAYKKANADGIIGFGGGSAIDISKAIRLMVTHPGHILDYDESTGGCERIKPKMPWMVAIPTTSGTGSEVGRSAVVSDPKSKVKKTIFSPYLMPPEVIADPALTLELPPKLTAATGADALSHCIEAYLSTSYHPLCDSVALGGIKLIGRSLAEAVHHGSSLTARSDMMMAAMMGAVAFQKGLGVTHSLAHPLSTLKDVHHGLANGIMLPHAMKFNLEGAESKLADVAVALGAKPVGSKEELAEEAVQIVKSLMKNIGIPQKLKEAGVTEELVEPLADLAIHDGCHSLNPRPCTREDFVRLYHGAL
ncbi:MAG: iron-containing alcohol dehydrogenase [Deltaproteobacteria bacterium]|nr:iron-containing alcohol dehydrogenase [Deltaproteobacteria bacterium]